MKETKIASGDSGQRLDKYLLKYFNKAPKSFIYKLLRKKNIKLNGKRAEGSELIQEGDVLQVYVSADTLSTMQEAKTVIHTKKSFDIVYEDDDIILVNKPVGLLSQPDISSDNNTLNDQLLYYLYQNGGYDTSKEASFKPGVCNRLDRNTSGIVAMGKTLEATKALNDGFKGEGIDKYYITVVRGIINKGGKIVAYHMKGDNNTAEIYDYPQAGAKKVVTQYRPLKKSGAYTVLEIKLLTGKAHQIRASLSDMGYPIVGDRKYGDPNVNREFKQKYGLDNQLLHAYKLVIKEKIGVLAHLCNKEFISKPSGSMNKVLESLGWGNNAKNSSKKYSSQN